MKTYKPQELKNAVKEQGYKIAALDNNKGERIQNFNALKHTPILKQLDLIQKRLNSDLFEDGIYYVTMATSVRGIKTADRYPIVKGKFTPEMLDEKQNTPVYIQSPSQDVLSWEAALSYQKQISDLTSQIKALQLENNYLQVQIEDLENDEGEGLSAPATGGNDFLSFLKESVPNLLPVVDRYFNIEEQKINLESQKLNRQPQQHQQQKQRTQPQEKKEIVIGSFNHLALIEHYFNTDQDEKLNLELDKLEALNPTLCAQVCEKLGIDLTDDEGGNNE